MVWCVGAPSTPEAANVTVSGPTGTPVTGCELELEPNAHGVVCESDDEDMPPVVVGEPINPAGTDEHDAEEGPTADETVAQEPQSAKEKAAAARKAATETTFHTLPWLLLHRFSGRVRHSLVDCCPCHVGHLLGQNFFLGPSHTIMIP